ncbi:MAG TPA: hypothetical protein VFZ02_00980, partial [Ktedonobacteraceae bacterium]
RSRCFACLGASGVDESRNARSCEPESLQDVEPRTLVPRLLPLCALLLLSRNNRQAGKEASRTSSLAYRKPP